MAYFFRVMLFVLPMFYHAFAHADVPAQDFYDMGSYGSSTTKEGACSKISQYGYSVAPDGNSCQKPDGTNYYWVHSFTCTSGTLSGSTCVGAVPPVTCSSDFTTPTVRSYTLDAAVNTKALLPSDIPAQSCIAGCTWQTQGAYSTFTLPDGSKHIEIGTRPTGAACSLTDATPAQPTTLTLSKQDCLAKGMSFGQVNSIDVCLKAGTSTSATVGSKTDSSTKSTVNGAPVNDEKSTDTSTVNNDNSVTTNRSTTVNNPDGTKTTKEQTKTEDKSKFCEENPNSKICQDDKKSSFTAACPQSTCDGDAVQCAIAKRQQQDACDAQASKDLITSKSSSALGDKLVDGHYSDDVQGFIDGNGDSKRTVNLPSSLSEDGNASYSSDGFGDVSISVLGRNITLPISKVNEYFGYFGFVLLGLAYMTSYKIVSGAI